MGGEKVWGLLFGGRVKEGVGMFFPPPVVSNGPEFH